MFLDLFNMKFLSQNYIEINKKLDQVAETASIINDAIEKNEADTSGLAILEQVPRIMEATIIEGLLSLDRNFYPPSQFIYLLGRIVALLSYIRMGRRRTRERAPNTIEAIEIIQGMGSCILSFKQNIDTLDIEKYGIVLIKLCDDLHEYAVLELVPSEIDALDREEIEKRQYWLGVSCLIRSIGLQSVFKEFRI